MARKAMITRLFQAYWRMTRTMTLGVAGLLFDSEGRVLLVRPRTGGDWRLPMGAALKSETASEALGRHLREQAAMALMESPQLLAIYANLGVPPGDHIVAFTAAAHAPLPESSSGFERQFFTREALSTGTDSVVVRRLDDHARGAPSGETW